MKFSLRLVSFGFTFGLFNRSSRPCHRVASTFQQHQPGFLSSCEIYQSAKKINFVMDRPDASRPKASSERGHSGSNSYATRATVHDDPPVFPKSVRAEKEKYMRMPLDEKRKTYKCKKFLELREIPTWNEMGADRSSKKTHLHRGDELKYTVKSDLNKKISLLLGDITSLEIDAIVNAANNSLLGGGGVDGAIHWGAGPFLKKECSCLKGCDTGDAKITSGYMLPAKYVIHTVGPIGENPKALHSAYRRSLEVMKQNKLTSVAFPCISTGIYGYPVPNATNVALDTIRNWLENDDYGSNVERVVLCVFLPKDLEVYENLLNLYFPMPTGNNGERKEAASPTAETERESQQSPDTKDNSSSVDKGTDIADSDARASADGDTKASVDGDTKASADGDTKASADDDTNASADGNTEAETNTEEKPLNGDATTEQNKEEKGGEADVKKEEGK